MGSSPNGGSICDDDKFTEFHQGKIYFSHKLIMYSNQFTKEITKLAKKNSVLLSVRAPVGEVNITNRTICIGRGLCSISLLLSESNDFLFYWLKALKPKLVSKATGTTFIAITVDVVKNLLIPFPPFEEQERIVKTLQNITSILENVESNLT